MALQTNWRISHVGGDDMNAGQAQFDVHTIAPTPVRRRPASFICLHALPERPRPRGEEALEHLEKADELAGEPNTCRC